MNTTRAPLVPAPSVAALSAHPEPSAWPLRNHLELPPRPSSVRCARRHARQLLARWHLDGSARAVELVVSELVTNAVRACGGMTPGPHVRLWLCSDLDRVLVQVWDSSSLMPVRQDPGPDEVGGRGLLLVDALSKDWGAYQPATLAGKVTWAIMAD